MIDQLSIHTFRGFAEYKIDDIGRVNLLVGTNNSGKTSILEAIRLFQSKGFLPHFLSILADRGEQINDVNNAQGQQEGDLRRLFHNFQLSLSSEFRIIGTENERMTDLSAFITEIPHDTDMFYRFPKFTGSRQLEVKWSNEDENLAYNYPVSPDGGLPCKYEERSTFYGNAQENMRLKYVPAVSLSPQQVIALFEEIVLSPDEELVTEALQIIEPDIVRLASYAGGRQQYPGAGGFTSRGGILVKSKKWDERIPIGSLGDGIWRLLGLILSLIGAKNGTLLIDEIDTGLHHSVMEKMWKLLCLTAHKQNVQIFATTHSNDCWKSLAELAVDEELAHIPIRIHRIDKEKPYPETFTNQEMNIALEREIEVR